MKKKETFDQSLGNTVKYFFNFNYAAEVALVYIN